MTSVSCFVLRPQWARYELTSLHGFKKSQDLQRASGTCLELTVSGVGHFLVTSLVAHAKINMTCVAVDPKLWIQHLGKSL